MTTNILEPNRLSRTIALSSFNIETELLKTFRTLKLNFAYYGSLT